jgi:ParB-like chromosome segregation protein Spo0J
MREQPVNRVQWVHRDNLKPNRYNPNAVAPPEMKLLKISILEDGWTQPIVTLENGEIVDGFHRWTVSGDVEVYRKTGGYVPIVVISPGDKASQQMATVRHNRARGTHAVLKMADIVSGMIAEGMSMNEICERLQMEDEEVIRLANRKGIPKTDIVVNNEWSKSWKPE